MRVARDASVRRNRAGRFSRNAVMPSAKSSVPGARAETHGFGVELLRQRAAERFAQQALGVADRQ